jgi:enoyl-CoA hydratase
VSVERDLQSPQPPLIIRRSSAVLHLTLNRPEKLNCLSPDLVDQLHRALDSVGSDTRCIVVTGAGRAFCAGGDLEAVQQYQSQGGDIETFHRSISWALRKLAEAPVPVLCAVNGVAVAGGLEIAAACDIVIADAKARFGDGHAVYGLLPGGGGSVRLPRIIGPNRAKFLMMTGRQVDAVTMREWGLVTEVAPPGELTATVDMIVEELLSRSAAGLRRMKSLVMGGLEVPSEEALEREQHIAAEHTESRDYREGLNAFRDKRAPSF